jgi:hypothetical protein
MALGPLNGSGAAMIAGAAFGTARPTPALRERIRPAYTGKAA